jgi:hypothetical protein
MNKNKQSFLKESCVHYILQQQKLAFSAFPALKEYLPKVVNLVLFSMLHECTALKL